MRICFLTNNLDEKGGAGRYSREMVENISKQQNIEITVLTERKSDYKSEIPVLKKSYLLRNFFNVFINALKIRKYIKNCDIIHALDGYPYGVIAALANIDLNKKLIISGVGTHSVLPLDKFIKKYFLRWAYKKADKILCISKFTQDQILKRIRLDNIEVINLGVDYEKFQKSCSISGKKSDKVILSVGALKPRKGYHISIPAIAEAKKKYKNIKYYIVGGEPPKFYLDLIKKHNLENNVKFFQSLTDEDLIKLYYLADVFLLAPVMIDNNNFEGFGLVYLEAGACGMPVIGTKDCGAEDIIKDGITGFLVPQNNIQKTAEATLQLLDNPGLAKQLGENGKKIAQQMSWDNVVKRYIKVYENNFN